MYIRIAIVVLLLALTGWLHGLWTDRWGPPAELAAAAGRLPAVPLVIGEWDGRDITREESEVAARSTSPLIVRRYVHRPTGAAVGMLVTCGRPGGMVIEHTPRACYQELDFEESGAGQRLPVGPPDARCDGFAHTFVKTTGAGSSRVRLVWAWGDGQTWTFPDNPRVAFAKTPLLYKIYVTRELLSEDEPLADDPAVAFLRDCLPAITAALQPAP